LGGAHQANFDSGVTKRVFGQLLSWLANKNDRTFVVMTMNRIKGIAPETLRAGRFDAVFYVDLPSARERRQILEIQLRKRQVDLAELDLGEADWDALVQQTTDYSGSELEEVVREARYQSLVELNTGLPTFDMFLEAAREVRPLAVLNKEELEEMRDECKNRARPVSSPEMLPSSRRQVQTKRSP
jgi:SpoVK/Ycf46/Vps4 family AAA+-type ATPase